ncbi:MAG TPA: CopG family transcriptional regulator [Clostridiales bacterium]|nr:CopG family transcriptional regulator [Clostridiales bacterium]
MAELKKILISLPNALLEEVDSIASIEKINRSEFVRQAMKLYIREKKKLKMRDSMKKGYQEMAEINLKLAEICLEADNEIRKKYEDRLAECE